MCGAVLAGVLSWQSRDSILVLSYSAMNGERGNKIVNPTRLMRSLLKMTATHTRTTSKPDPTVRFQAVSRVAVWLLGGTAWDTASPWRTRGCTGYKVYSGPY